MSPSQAERIALYKLLILGILYGGPALIGLMFSTMLLSGHTWQSVPVLICWPAYVAFFVWYERPNMESAKESLGYPSCAWLGGMALGCLMWLAISGFGMMLTPAA